MTASDIIISFPSIRKAPCRGLPCLLIYCLSLRPDSAAEVCSCRERRYLHDVSRLRRVDETVAAHEEAHVAPAAESEDIARLQLADAHRRARIRLVVRAVADAYARPDLVAVHGKT